MSVQSDDLSQARAIRRQTRCRRRSATNRLTTSRPLRAELAEIEQKADEYLRLAQRTQADFINYRRRMEEERAQQARDANIAYLQRLLPILDDFERALANAAPERSRIECGARASCWSIAICTGCWPPTTSSASRPRAPSSIRASTRRWAASPARRCPRATSLHVVRQGYRKGERMLRPAQVIIAAKPT